MNSESQQCGQGLQRGQQSSQSKNISNRKENLFKVSQ